MKITQELITELWQEYAEFTEKHLYTANVSANLGANFFIAYLAKKLHYEES